MAASSQASSLLLKACKTCFAGALVATPIISVLQGALLLLEYRQNHGNAPYPETPSRGIVIVEPPRNSELSFRSQAQGIMNTILRRQTTLLNNEAPLRILVLGDSLAAGVGMSQSSTPALPESIARGLSQAMGGRAVYWTCIGSPGSTSLEIVGQILNLDDLRAPLITKILEWQEETRLRAETTKRAAREWWETHNEPVEVDEQNSHNPVARWWKRVSLGIQRDVRNLKKVVHHMDESLDRKERMAQKLDNRVTKLLRRQSLTPSYLGQYDIAVVLCGLNDLKDTFLPFLTAGKRQSVGEREETNNHVGLQHKLIQIVHALRRRMKISGGREEETEPSLDAEISMDETELELNRFDAPLIVFPALPIEPTILSQVVPLSWFLIPLVRTMDRNKQMLANMYPGLVLFVDSPSPEVFSDAQMQRGSIWEELQKENLVLMLSDVGKSVQRRIKGLMDQHYLSLVHDDGDELYELDLDGVDLLDPRDKFKHPGATLVASDGIHPNDLGYKVWGRFLARQIIEHLETDRRLDRHHILDHRAPTSPLSDIDYRPS